MNHLHPAHPRRGGDFYTLLGFMHTKDTLRLSISACLLYVGCQEADATEMQIGLTLALCSIHKSASQVL